MFGIYTQHGDGHPVEAAAPSPVQLESEHRPRMSVFLGYQKSAGGMGRQVPEAEKQRLEPRSIRPKKIGTEFVAGELSDTHRFVLHVDWSHPIYKICRQNSLSTTNSSKLEPSNIGLFSANTLRCTDRVTALLSIHGQRCHPRF
jgi:hypothetical protein